MTETVMVKIEPGCEKFDQLTEVIQDTMKDIAPILQGKIEKYVKKYELEPYQITQAISQQLVLAHVKTFMECLPPHYDKDLMILDMANVYRTVILENYK